MILFRQKKLEYYFIIGIPSFIEFKDKVFPPPFNNRSFKIFIKVLSMEKYIEGEGCIKKAFAVEGVVWGVYLNLGRSMATLN